MPDKLVAGVAVAAARFGVHFWPSRSSSWARDGAGFSALSSRPRGGAEFEGEAVEAEEWRELGIKVPSFGEESARLACAWARHVLVPCSCEGDLRRERPRAASRRAA